MPDEPKKTEPEGTWQRWFGHLDRRRLIEVFVVESVGVWFTASGLYGLVHLNTPDAVLIDLAIGLTAAIAGLTLAAPSVNRQQVFYCCGAFLSPVLCHHLVYSVVVKPRQDLSSSAFLKYIHDNPLIGYFVALLIGAILALETEIRYRTNKNLLIPTNFFIGTVMGILSILLIYVFVLLAIFWGLTGFAAAVIICVVTFYALRLRAQRRAGKPPEQGDGQVDESAAGADHRENNEHLRANRDDDLELFDRWMSQLNHEDYLLVSRTALGVFGQSIFVFGYIFANQYKQPVIAGILVWSNLLMSIVIFISILAAFRVYIETRVRLRPLVQRHPDFPIRRLPDIHPGLGLYCPVGLGLAMVVIWSSLLYVEAGDDPLRQIGAIVITAFLAIAGIVSAIGVGFGLGEDAEAGAQQ